ncbi:MAG: hypothetical protein IKO72_01565 [Kiritimatiellae bacterium]|nr:hypothetical protein [Kiritimatiellia bacterium]
MKTRLVMAALVAAAAGAWAMDDATFEAMRRAAVDRPRAILWDDDGCDMIYYPYGCADLADKPISAANFEAPFLKATENTLTDTICYSTVFGFGYFSSIRAGIVNTNEFSEGIGKWRNAVAEFRDKFGKDALDLATDFARRNKKEIFLSLRFNDNHDAGSSWTNRNVLFSPFKAENPDCLVGMRPGRMPKCCGWAAADFSKEKVRAFCLKYMREYFENYDLDGLEYDFFRHPQLFSSVAWGGRASQAELDVMTAHMKDLRALADEVGRRRGRPFVVCMRVPDSVEYCRAIGIDLERWLQEKVVDFLIVGGYFQLEPWSKSAALAHRHGVKCYASLDESRLARVKGARLLPGRDGVESLLARASAAVMQGMDGICYFNFEYAPHDRQRKVLSASVHDLNGRDKLYFSVYNGGGGYLPRSFLVGGDDFIHLGGINPAKAVKLKAGDKFAFNLPVGDDLNDWRAKKVEPRITAKLLAADASEGALKEFKINGTAYTPDSFVKGVFTFTPPPSAILRGDNRIEVEAGDAGITLNDFSLAITGKRK